MLPTSARYFCENLLKAAQSSRHNYRKKNASFSANINGPLQIKARPDRRLLAYNTHWDPRSLPDSNHCLCLKSLISPYVKRKMVNMSGLSRLRLECPNISLIWKRHMSCQRKKPVTKALSSLASEMHVQFDLRRYIKMQHPNQHKKGKPIMLKLRRQLLRGYKSF